MAAQRQQGGVLMRMGVVLVLLSQITVATEEKVHTAQLKPSLTFKTLGEYEGECGEAGVVLDGEFVVMFAPKVKEREAKIVFRFLVKAYDELYRIVGRHTEYKIVVYHFPQGNKHGWGGTSNCEIGYSYKALDLDSQKEWRKHKVPHVSGYIEEMAHSFVHAAKVQFGWEMVGWSIGVQVTRKVASNPLFLRQVRGTRKLQKKTYDRYVKNGYMLPEDVPANKCDRIHAYLLGRCERKYGRNFWRDAFGEIGKEFANLRDAVKLGDGDKIRNKRYQIIVACFDRLEGLDFRTMLEKAHVSLTADVKALHPEEAGWDRRLVSSDPVNNVVYDCTPPQSLDKKPVILR